MKVRDQKLVPIRQGARAQRTRWHALLDDVLDSGDPKVISAITLNLEFFSEVTGEGAWD